MSFDSLLLSIYLSELLANLQAQIINQKKEPIKKAPKITNISIFSPAVILFVPKAAVGSEWHHLDLGIKNSKLEVICRISSSNSN